MMKKIIYMASLLLAVTLWSCSDDEGEKYAYNPTITITSSNLEFTSGGGESVLTFSSTAGNAVSATLDADWCRVTALAGNSATIEVDENTAYESRNARLVLSNGVDEVEVAVMQEGFYLYYDVSTMNKLIGNEASDWHVDFSSPIDDVTFKISSYATNWLSAQSDEGGFTIHCKENTTGKPRWAEVLVQSNGVTLTYTVTQLDMDDLTSVFIFQDTEQNVNQYMEKIPVTEEDGNYMFDFSSVLGMPITLTARYASSTGNFTISGEQVVGQANGMNLINACIGDDGSIYYGGSMDLVLNRLSGGNIAYTLQDNGSLNGVTVAYFAFLYSTSSSLSGVDLDMGVMLFAEWQLAHESLFE